MKNTSISEVFFCNQFFYKRVFNKYLIIYNRKLNVNRNIAQRYCIFVWIMLYYRKIDSIKPICTITIEYRLNL